jgi:hypothetical protein
VFDFLHAHPIVTAAILGALGAGIKLGWPTISGMWIDKRELRVTVHKACLGVPGIEHYFINVTNVSRNRELEITHVWFDLDPQIPVMPRERPLPKRLKPTFQLSSWCRPARSMS